MNRPFSSRKSIALLLVIMLLVSAVPAFASAESVEVSKDSYPIVKEKITIKGIMPDNPWAKPYGELLMAQWMEEMTNIQIDMEVVPSSAYPDRKSIILASDDYPEFFYMADLLPDEIRLHGKSGTFIDLLPLIEAGYAPNLKKFMDANPEILRSVGSPMYALPYIMNDLNEPFISINTKWMEKLGLSEPQNLDEFVEILRAFRDKDPNGNGLQDEIPFSSAFNVHWLYPYATLFGIPTNGFYVDGDKVVYGATTDNFKEFLKFMRMCFEEKLLDNNVLVQAVPNDELVMAAAREEKIGSIYLAYPSIIFGAELAGDYGVLVPFKAEGKDAAVWPESITVINGTFAITDKCKNPEALLRWVDFFYSKEGMEMMWMGKEGVTFERDAEGIWNYTKPDPSIEDLAFKGSFSVQGGHYFPGYNEPAIDGNTSNPELRRVVALRERLKPLFVPTLPSVTFTDEETEFMALYQIDIDNYLIQTTAAFINGDIDIDAGWEEYKATLESMELTRLTEIIQAAYDRYMSQ